MNARQQAVEVIRQMAPRHSHPVRHELLAVAECAEAAEGLAGGVRSFLESLPFCAPENIEVQAQAKLVEPLQHYREVTGG